LRDGDRLGLIGHNVATGTTGKRSEIVSDTSKLQRRLNGQVLMLRGRVVEGWANRWTAFKRRIRERIAALQARFSDASAESARNVDTATVAGFGREWTRFPQGVSELSADERAAMFEGYFGIFPWVSLPANSVGMDVGCGSGRWAFLAAPRVGHLHLVDASEDAILVAKANLADVPNVSFHVASVADLPVDNASLDFAYAVGVLHHVPETEQAIRCIAGKLKPGAPFLIYLYYALENRPTWYRGIWRVSNALRIVLSRSPAALRYAASQVSRPPYIGHSRA
jgi:2-polyprenyl-3-methyl-5-hydroxy-6-metoxy-1,4-benzoquinol methylase